jgi:hypothetical protein
LPRQNDNAKSILASGIAKGRVKEKGRALNAARSTQAHLGSRKTGKGVFKKMLK